MNNRVIQQLQRTQDLAQKLSRIRSSTSQPHREVQVADTPPPAFYLDAPCSLDEELRSLGLPDTLVVDLSNQYDVSAHRCRSACLERFADMWTRLNAISPSSPTVTAKLGESIRWTYNNALKELKNTIMDMAQTGEEESDNGSGAYAAHASLRSDLLGHAFAQNPNPSAAEKDLLAQNVSMCQRQISTWFQNKRSRTEKVGYNATGIVQYGSRKVSTSKAPACSGRDDVCGLPSPSDTEAAYETIYDSTSDDGYTRLLKPSPHPRRGVFDAPVPSFVFPARYPPPRKHQPAASFPPPSWRREHDSNTHVRPALLSVDQLAEEFSRLSVKPRIIRGHEEKRPESVHNRPRRLHKPTQRPDRHAATMAYTVTPIFYGACNSPTHVDQTFRRVFIRPTRRAPGPVSAFEPSPFTSSLIQSDGTNPFGRRKINLRVRNNQWREPVDPTWPPNSSSRSASHSMTMTSSISGCTPIPRAATPFTLKRIQEESEESPCPKRPRLESKKPSLALRRPQHTPRSSQPPTPSPISRSLTHTPSLTWSDSRSVSGSSLFTIYDTPSPASTMAPMTPPAPTVDLVAIRGKDHPISRYDMPISPQSMAFDSIWSP